MLTIAKLFGKSPFSPLQSHMNKVSSCIKKLTEIFQEIEKQNFEKIEILVAELSKLEHEADLTKNDIRNHLPKSLFLPISREQFLEILSTQDNIADKAEEIGNILLLCPKNSLRVFTATFQNFFKKNLETFWDARQIIKEFDELLESSFGGLEAEKVKSMVDQAAYKEYQADVLKTAVRKEFFNLADTLTPSAFYLWANLINEVGSISHISEKLANQIGMILELR
jgi:predicted phosphate transport protein (TIGR00153 family)